MYKVIATRVNSAELKPGDLFSAMGQEFWDTPVPPGCIGQALFVRTDGECFDTHKDVYRIEIRRDDDDAITDCLPIDDTDGVPTYGV